MEKNSNTKLKMYESVRSVHLQTKMSVIILRIFNWVPILQRDVIILTLSQCITYPLVRKKTT